MMKFYKLLYSMELRPKMILLSKDLDVLYVFITGYISGSEESDDAPLQIMEKFYKFLLEKYSLIGNSMWWFGVINNLEKDREVAFDKFYQLFNEFLVETTGRNLEENANLE
ncbi:hypothetical protein A4V34_05345 [Listeria monocytogenes]|nr:hypothetical protein [Listeria monocytogenes]